MTESCSLWNSTLNPCKSSDQDLQKGTIKQSRTIFCQLAILILVTNPSTGETYVTTSCCLTMCISNLILQKAQSNVLNCTYSDTRLPNSYPPFKWALSWQIMSARHEHHIFKNNALNRTFIHGACVKARLPDHLDQQKCTLNTTEMAHQPPTN